MEKPHSKVSALNMQIHTQKCFKAGQIKHFTDSWEKLTSDPWILEAIQGVNIEFTSPPYQSYIPKEPTLGNTEANAVDNELLKLLAKGVIKKSQHEDGEFISNIFLRLKPNGTYRLILNLKHLNEFVEYHHFKMDSIHTAVQLMKQNCFMASIDLQDAYYSVPVSENYQKYLKFSWRGNLYKFTCLPNGLASAPRIFTKLLKPVYASLRNLGHIVFGYIDDSYLQGDDAKSCKDNVLATHSTFTNLGFLPHEEKSVVEPTQELTLLGFVLNSLTMTISLTPLRAQKLENACSMLLKMDKPSIRTVAQVIGLMVASFPAIPHAQLFYRALERDKTNALQQQKGDFEATMTYSSEAKNDLKWWVKNASTMSKSVLLRSHDLTIQSDASLLGWGAHCNNEHAGGQWTNAEAAHHINYLETIAAYFALQSFCKKSSDIHVRLELDNTTAVTYINNMGGNKSTACNRAARQLWLWCIEHNIWVSAVHIPGTENIEADKQSRIFDEHTEWSLRDTTFDQICKKFFTPTIDLFASRLNHKVDSYVSWHPDPGAIAVDAFTQNWADQLFYAFPPFSLITRVLQKVRKDRAEGMVVVPLWPTQPWYPVIMTMLVRKPCLLPKSPHLLYLKHQPTMRHPLYKKLQLLACHLSGNPLNSKEFQTKLPALSSSHGVWEQNDSINRALRNGKSSVVNRKLIQFDQL